VSTTRRKTGKCGEKEKLGIPHSEDRQENQKCLEGQVKQLKKGFWRKCERKVCMRPLSNKTVQLGRGCGATGGGIKSRARVRKDGMTKERWRESGYIQKGEEQKRVIGKRC